MFGGKKWSPEGKHCFVTGGSSGLGLSLAILLTQLGAHVSIVARDQKKLESALEQLEAARKHPDQILKTYSYSIQEAAGAAAAIDAACEPHGGRAPDVVFNCAGTSRPGYWLEQDETSMKSGMDSTYWAQAWTALAVSKRMVKDGVKGKIVFVGSVLSYMSIVGYSTYSPGKFAVRGLAETLRQELLLYDIDVHMMFPGNIASPGFIEENKYKPDLVKKIEEDENADGTDPAILAGILLKGIRKGEFHITYGFVGNAFRVTGKATTPGNNLILDIFYLIAGYIGVNLWRRGVDKVVRNEAKAHHEYLENKGFFK
ncbi:oxidoreductase [Abortiporus biennis]|nr:oxidoreductase [Abortiporus biennis]